MKNNRFIRRYWNALIALGDTLQKEKPDFIIAVARKGPLLLELLHSAGIWLEPIPIISEMAIDFIPPPVLKRKKILIVDDIIIRGTTVKSLVEKLAQKYDAEIKVICLAIDNETLAIKNDEGHYYFELKDDKRVFLNYEVALTKNERFIFCNEIVQSFIFLNRPYNLDYPIFYSSIDIGVLSSLVEQSEHDKAYNLSMTYEQDNGYLRYTFVPKPFIVNNICNNMLRGFYLCPQICKVRVYYDEDTGNVRFSPILVFGVDDKILKQEVIFSNHLSRYNDMLKQARKLLDQSRDFIDSRDSLMAIYRIVYYVVNYIYGLSFILRNSSQIGNLNLSNSVVLSDMVSYKDLRYLFGPDLAKIILNLFESCYVQTIEELKKMQAKTALDMTYQQLSAGNVMQPVFDTSREELYAQIDNYLSVNLRSDDALTNQLATIFEGLYYAKEIPTQSKPREIGIEDKESKRLLIGFTYDQIKEILYRKGILSREYKEIDLCLSLAFDLLVDTGVQVPIFCARDNGYFERAYRYGEDYFSAKKYKWLVAEIIKRLFKNMGGTYKKTLLPQITLEKIGVCLQIQIRKSGLVPFLEKLLPVGDEQITISPTVAPNGKILHISYELAEGSQSQG
ncbi:MAG: phosphoribosyltransferase, partial [Nitrososphaerales archaeon]